MSIVGERFFRRAFINDRLLSRQNIALLRNREIVRRYVPPALVEHIIDGKLDEIDTPKRRRVTILFSDIVGFTEIADRVEPEVMTQVIREYMAVMVEVVNSHNGTVNEFAGDGLMAIYGDVPNSVAGLSRWS